MECGAAPFVTRAVRLHLSRRHGIIIRRPSDLDFANAVGCTDWAQRDANAESVVGCLASC